MKPLYIFKNINVLKVLLEIIYLVTFYMPRIWLKSNQSRVAIITSAVPPHVHAFFKLTDLFSFLTTAT